MTKSNKTWYTYLLICSDDTIYCGSTTDIDRRTEEHNTKPTGAKYTKTRRPVYLVWYNTCKTRSEACKLEANIKKLTRKEKQLLIFTGKSYDTLFGKEVT